MGETTRTKGHTYDLPCSWIISYHLSSAFHFELSQSETCFEWLRHLLTIWCSVWKFQLLDMTALPRFPSEVFDLLGQFGWSGAEYRLPIRPENKTKKGRKKRLALINICSDKMLFEWEKRENIWSAESILSYQYVYLLRFIASSRVRDEWRRVLHVFTFTIFNHWQYFPW